jgi:hypothetical protein
VVQVETPVMDLDECAVGERSDLLAATGERQVGDRAKDLELRGLVRHSASPLEERESTAMISNVESQKQGILILTFAIASKKTPQYEVSSPESRAATYQHG